MSNRPRTNLTQRQRLRLTQGLTTAVRILRFDASGLSRYLEEQAAENPHLRLEEASLPAGDWLPRWTGAFGLRGGSAEPDSMAMASPSLSLHVAAEIRRLVPEGRERRLAQALAEALEPTGWLGRPLAEIAAEERVPLREVEAVLRLLHGCEPSGLFARSLAECLELQARDRGIWDEILAVMLANLPLVAAGDVARLARLARSTAEEVQLRFRRIRSLNPKPGAVFDPAPPLPREPDLAARPDGAGWTVELNRAALPVLAVVAAARGTATPAVRRQVSEARSLRRMVAARSETLLRVAGEIVRRQAAALHEGPGSLVPMTMAEVAAALGLHPTTVGRAVAGVSLDTPRGPVWLRRLFTGAAGPDDIAAGALRARLAALIAAEDPRRPLSDAALAEALAEAGTGPPARRTIAKYRALLGLPPAHLRRRAMPQLREP